ncbi:MAG TPA: BrnA antitoxin family protein [Devosia sp.]|nr:BrnA antitoxin family protein [Devosia sp.]
MVRYEFDLLNPPPLTPEQIERLKALDNLRAEDIDTSDIPVLGEDVWQNGIRNPYYARALKAQLTIRLDADILDWFKRHAKDGKGYQTDINKALRAYVAAQERRAAKQVG